MFAPGHRAQVESILKKHGYSTVGELATQDEGSKNSKKRKYITLSENNTEEEDDDFQVVKPRKIHTTNKRGTNYAIAAHGPPRKRILKLRDISGNDVDGGFSESEHGTKTKLKPSRDILGSHGTEVNASNCTSCEHGSRNNTTREEVIVVATKEAHALHLNWCPEKMPPFLDVPGVYHLLFYRLVDWDWEAESAEEFITHFRDFSDGGRINTSFTTA